MKTSLPRTKLVVLSLLCSTLLGGSALARAQEAAADDEPEVRAVQSPEVEHGQKLVAPNSHLPKLALTPQILYQTLLAEIAAQRGNMALAASAYIDLAQNTRDPRIARRATEFSLYVRNPENAVNMARLWVDTEPDSVAARQMLAGLLLNLQHPDEAVQHMARLLTLEGPEKIGPGLLNLQRLLQRHPDKKVALHLIEQLSAPHGQLAEAHFVLAQAALNNGDEARALQEVERSLALRADWELAVLLKAQLQLRSNSSLAEATLQKFIASHPLASDARLAYARLLIGSKRYPEARREFALLLEGHRDNPEILYAIALLSVQLNELEPAEKYLKRLLDIGHGESSLVRYYLGQIAEDTKRPEEAMRWYQGVTSGEHYLPAQGRVALLLAKLGRLDEARATLQRAAASTPAERLRLLIAESQLLSNAGRHAEAYELLNHQLAEQSEQPELLYETALLAEKVGRYEIMEQYLRKLLSLKPDHAHAYNALGYSLADRAQRLDEAQQLIERGLTLAPNDAFILDSKGWLQYRRGEHDAALETLRKALNLRPDPEIAAHLGEVLWSMGRRDEALKTWQDAMKAHPDNAVLVNVMKKFNP